MADLNQIRPLDTYIYTGTTLDSFPYIRVSQFFIQFYPEKMSNKIFLIRLLDNWLNVVYWARAILIGGKRVSMTTLIDLILDNWLNNKIRFI